MTTDKKVDNLKRECRFATYVPPPEHGEPDIHVIKEIIHHPDGRVEPSIKIIENFKRPYYVTKKALRNHNDHKEWEKLENVDKYASTQTDLVKNASRSLGMPWFKGDLRKLSKSPYLYGTDITSTAIIKQMYLDKFDIRTPYSLAVMDTETDVVNGTGEIILISLTYRKHIYCVAIGDYFKGLANPLDQCHKVIDKYLSRILREREATVVLVHEKTPVDGIKYCADKAHELMPDFLAFWNIDFDMTKILQACEKEGVDPKDIFSDPRVPAPYKSFKYKRGPNKQVTASGKVKPIKPAAQWHTVTCPASFYFIDAMCVYKHVRTGLPEEQSYALQAILTKEIGEGKLSFQEADHVEGLKWHQLMQADYKYEYSAYNIMDSVRVEQLDEKTKDASITFPMFSGCSDFSRFNSQPRRTVDKLHHHLLKEGYVIGVSSSEMATEMDDETLGLEDWITTLPAHTVCDNGLKCIEEFPDLVTNIRRDVADQPYSRSA